MKVTTKDNELNGSKKSDIKSSAKKHGLYYKSGNIKLFTGAMYMPEEYKLPSTVKKIAILPTECKPAVPFKKISEGNPPSLNMDLSKLIEVKKASVIKPTPFTSFGPAYHTDNAILDFKHINIPDKKRNYDFLELEGINSSFLLQEDQDENQKKEVNEKVEDIQNILNQIPIEEIRKCSINNELTMSNKGISNKELDSDNPANFCIKTKDKVESYHNNGSISKEDSITTSFEENKDVNTILKENQLLLAKLEHLQDIRLKYRITQISKQEYELAKQFKLQTAKLISKVPPGKLININNVHTAIERFPTFDANYSGSLKTYKPYTFHTPKK